MIELITPMLITFNEAFNLPRVLDKLLWAKKILVIDSGSTDETLDIMRTYSQLEVLYHPFKTFADQCNFGLTNVETPWVLSLDADYELSDEFVEELRCLEPNERTAGYRARFIYRIYGRSLRGAIYPPRTVLYSKDKAYYRDEGHGHRVQVQGGIELLHAAIYHDDRKPLSRWMASQQLYARKEACYLLNSSRETLSRTDIIRLMAWLTPVLVPIYTLIIRGCILDGWAGWHYALQRLYFEVLVTLEIVDYRLGERCQSSHSKPIAKQ